MFLLFLQENNTLGIFSRTTLPFSCVIIPNSSQPHFIDSLASHEVQYFYEDKNYGVNWSRWISLTLWSLTRQLLDDRLKKKTNKQTKGTQLFIYYFTVLISVVYDTDWSTLPCQFHFSWLQFSLSIISKIMGIFSFYWHVETSSTISTLKEYWASLYLSWKV